MIRRIQPAWLRFAVLGMIGLPMLTGWPLRDIGNRLNKLSPVFTASTASQPATVGQATPAEPPPQSRYCHQGHTSAHALVWFFYACGISMLIVANAGWRDWFVFFSIASLLTTVTCLTGAVFSSARHVLFGDPESNAQVLWSIHYLIKACIMLSVIPFGMFSVGCFSPSTILLSAVKHGRVLQSLTIRLTTIVRVLQHVVYTVIALFNAWREENPQVIVPRHRVDMRGNIATSFAKWAAWGEEATRTWCFALLMHTLEPIPLFCREIEQASRVLYVTKNSMTAGTD